MKYLLILFVFAPVLLFSQQTVVCRGKKITVTGTAINLKAGAAIRTEDHLYIVENLFRWPDSEENKTVRVRGKLLIYCTFDTENNPVTQYMPEMHVLRRPKIFTDEQ